MPYVRIDPHYSAKLIFNGAASVSLIPKFIHPPCTLIDPFVAGIIQLGVVPPSLLLPKVHELVRYIYPKPNRIHLVMFTNLAIYIAKSIFLVGQNNDSTVGC